MVLSACQTSITDFRTVPDEAIGLPAGFLQAGVPTVVGTLWPVNDLSTERLMGRFYRYYLQDRQDPATALRRAQLWLRAATAEEFGMVQAYKQQYEEPGRRDAHALQTMRYYRANPNVTPFAHPYYWAPFVLSGAGAPSRVPDGHSASGVEP